MPYVLKTSIASPSEEALLFSVGLSKNKNFKTVEIGILTTLC